MSSLRIIQLLQCRYHQWLKTCVFCHTVIGRAVKCMKLALLFSTGKTVRLCTELFFFQICHTVLLGMLLLVCLNCNVFQICHIMLRHIAFGLKKLSTKSHSFNRVHSRCAQEMRLTVQLHDLNMST